MKVFLSVGSQTMSLNVRTAMLTELEVMPDATNALMEWATAFDGAAVDDDAATAGEEVGL